MYDETGAPIPEPATDPEAFEPVGVEYVYRCEHVTGYGPAPFSGERVPYAECDRPASRQASADGAHYCDEHDPEALGWGHVR